MTEQIFPHGRIPSFHTTPNDRGPLRLGTLTGRGIRGAVGTLLFRPTFGFDAGGIISHQFFRSYALTFDFDAMRLSVVGGRERSRIR